MAAPEVDLQYLVGTHGLLLTPAVEDPPEQIVNAVDAVASALTWLNEREPGEGVEVSAVGREPHLLAKKVVQIPVEDTASAQGEDAHPDVIVHVLKQPGDQLLLLAAGGLGGQVLRTDGARAISTVQHASTPRPR